MNGQVQHSPCTDIELQVETLGKSYQSITDNATIYRPVNATDLIMRCRCTNGNEIPIWLLPITSGFFACNNQSTGICTTNQTEWQQIKLPLVKKRYAGYYNCSTDLVSIGFNLFVFG